MHNFVVFVFAMLLLQSLSISAVQVTLSGSSPFQIYDGHGGLSAGASSRLLIDYNEPQRSEILDYLWKPNFGASLHMCKIEIGGDTQSTDGTESSYRHYREETPQCGTNRGYEMWLLSEAYKRNPDIQSFLLSWGVPNFVGNGTYFSDENIAYQVGYAQCVRKTIGGMNPHYIGIWNERSWGSIEYVVSLRNALDAAGLSTTRIIIPDGGDCGGITNAAKNNATFASSLYAYGEHYPCKNSCPETVDVGLKFWASEDYSTVADWDGAGCWGRSLNQNWVLLNSTSTISWSTIWSVYPKDSYFGNGLMYAFSPWSGNYVINDAIWTSAHWTQFMTVGWKLLQGNNAGMLPLGGSYITAISPDMKDFTLVLETLQGNCLRCSGGVTHAQNITFILTNGLPSPGTILKTWLTIQGNSFQPTNDITVASDGSIQVQIPADAMLTVSTITTAQHGSFPNSPIPPDAPFPLPWKDTFDTGYSYDQVPKYFADQGGSFAVRNGIMQQVVPADPGPNGWTPNRDPYTLLGDYTWTDITVTATVSFHSGIPDPGFGINNSPSIIKGDAPLTLQACDVTNPLQRWRFGSIASNYLSTDTSPHYCLDLPGCGLTNTLDLYDCVTTDCSCGCPGFQNLQYILTGSQLTTPLSSGKCVTLQKEGTLLLQDCKDGTLGQTWVYNSSSLQLSVTNPPNGHSPVCLDGGPPPPPPPYVSVVARVPTYGPMYSGYVLSTFQDATWSVSSGKTILANGSLPSGYNSSNWNVISISTKGSTISASFGGNQLWSGTDVTYTNGQAGVGSGYHYAAFDSFEVKVAV